MSETPDIQPILVKEEPDGPDLGVLSVGWEPQKITADDDPFDPTPIDKGGD